MDRLMEEEYVGMGRRIILCVIFLTLCFMTCFAEFPIVKGAETGVVFTDANDQITYRITSNGKEKTCEVIGWKNENYLLDNPACRNLIIPKEVEYDNNTYSVTAITPEHEIMISYADEIEIPETVTTINAKFFDFGFYEYENINADIIENGIKIVFKCSPSAFRKVKEISIANEAISSIIYVPDAYLEDYKLIFKGKTKCYIRDNDKTTRFYTGIPVRSIEDENPLPEGFIYEKSYYKIMDDEKKEVSLIKKIKETDESKTGSIYEQPSDVYYKGVEYKVVKIDYFAFCDAKWPVIYGIKLPPTIRYIESQSIGWQISSMDLSETCIDYIPENVVNRYYDEYDENPYLCKILLPETCLKIGKKAFYNCKRLKSISLPSSLKKIGKKAFSSKCRKYYVNGDSFPEGLEKQDMKSAKVYVPEKLLDIAKDKLKVKIKQDKCKIVCIK